MQMYKEMQSQKTKPTDAWAHQSQSTSQAPALGKRIRTEGTKPQAQPGERHAACRCIIDVSCKQGQSYDNRTCGFVSACELQHLSQHSCLPKGVAHLFGLQDNFSVQEVT